MPPNGKPRRRFEASSAPTTLTEITRRYYATAIALARAMGLPLSEQFIRDYRESISACFIESGRAGVRLLPTVPLPPLVITAPVIVTNGPVSQIANTSVDQTDALMGPITPDPEMPMVTHSNGVVPPPALTASSLPTSIPEGLQLPGGGALIVDLRPAQLSLLVGKVGLRSMTDKSLEPLHVALLRERARRFEAGKRAEGNGDGT
jgi:hypothetical protein